MTTTPKIGEWRAMGRAVGLVARTGRGWFVATVVLMSVSGLGMAAALLLGQRAVKRVTDSQAPQGDWLLWLLIGGVVVLAGVIAFSQLAATGFHRLLAERVMYAWNERVLQTAALTEIWEFERPEFHDRIRRARQGGGASIGISMAVPQLLAGLIASTGLLTALAITAPVLLPVVIASGVPLLLAGRANSREMYSFNFGNTPNDRERFALEGVLSSRDQSAEVRVFGMQGFLLHRWRELYEERIAGLTQLVVAFTRRSSIAAIGVALTLIVAVITLGWLLTTHRITMVTAAAAAVTTLMLGSQVQRIASSIADLRESAQQVADVELTTALTRQAAPKLPPAGPLRHLRADRVTFRYPAAASNALDGIDFSIEAGEMIAIVGINGSGKTTLAKLLCGLYEPASGSITWNGRPVEQVDLLGQVGAIFQTFNRYWFTATENIAAGAIAAGEVPSQSAVRRAAMDAGAHNLISELPHGYDTRLTVELDGGADLSLGQWQRIAIARVLYRDPSLVVLDEPTASLDAHAEADLFATLEKLRQGRTFIIISHRFSTVRTADRIVVMDAGRIIEQGAHHELMALDGRYAEMYAVQARSYQDTPPVSRDRTEAESRPGTLTGP
ncbi:ATP-binding cassette domain-containing protein [Microlunatus elymi]|uniref:ATP-binding cassette domain-containing protein n=1 Tax=Microlunatus elymi TaxID=2596828 RepID=A0A516PWA2_9ACTN|nr:ATP-binding cassette domain-containing protein [Microlunatus elymi]QDP95440.1 ATP-binding cassette domain-containing protein [Microlunatus elymi]